LPFSNKVDIKSVQKKSIKFFFLRIIPAWAERSRDARGQKEAFEFPLFIRQKAG
jgi:hypothetical protein